MDAAYEPTADPGPSLRPGRSGSVRSDTLTPARGAARVGDARRDPGAVVLEGVHALKHATRFGAAVEVVVTPDRDEVARLLAELAPDVVLPEDRTVEVPAGTWRGLVARELPSPVLAVARRPEQTPSDVLDAPGVVVVVDRPRHLGNLGAVIRVAAAADAGGVLVVGDADPWHPTAVRASAGLGFALPVARSDHLPDTERPVMALDPGGDELGRAVRLPADAVLLVGTERSGLADELRARAGRRVGLPMRDGVSSLNLATAVAAALYGGR